MTAHEVTGLLVMFAVSLFLGGFGYLVGRLRQPEDFMLHQVAIVAMAAGGVGMAIVLVRLLVAGLLA